MKIPGPHLRTKTRNRQQLITAVRRRKRTASGKLLKVCPLKKKGSGSKSRTGGQIIQFVRKTDINLKPTRTKDLDMSVKAPRSAEVRLMHPPAAKKKRNLETEPQQQRKLSLSLLVEEEEAESAGTATPRRTC